MEDKTILENQMLTFAISVASIKFTNAYDKGGSPYILHCLSVMNKMSTVKQKIVAVLHDVVEDTNTTLDDLLRWGMSQEIVDAIDAITRRKDEPYRDYINRLAKNELAKVVKIADLEDNMDLSRIPNLTEDDIMRLKKYQKAYDFLKSTFIVKIDDNKSLEEQEFYKILGLIKKDHCYGSILKSNKHIRYIISSFDMRDRKVFAIEFDDIKFDYRDSDERMYDRIVDWLNS